MSKNSRFIQSIEALPAEKKKEISTILLRAYCELAKVDFILIEMDFPGLFPMLDQKDSPSTLIFKLRKMFNTSDHETRTD